MPSTTTIVLFAIAAVALLLLPGPVVLYTVTRSIDQGWRAGMASVLAAGIGDLVHVSAATLGLSALLLSSAMAFTLVKYAGAAYLIYIGLRTLMTRIEQEQVQVAPQSLKRIFGQGLLVSILNPKTALFFLAFLPQFVAPERGPIAFQILSLGILFITLGLITNSLYVLLASAARSRLSNSATVRQVQRYCAGGVYIALGVTTAITGSD